MWKFLFVSCSFLLRYNRMCSSVKWCSICKQNAWESAKHNGELLKWNKTKQKVIQVHYILYPKAFHGASSTWTFSVLLLLLLLLLGFYCFGKQRLLLFYYCYIKCVRIIIIVKKHLKHRRSKGMEMSTIKRNSFVQKLWTSFLCVKTVTYIEISGFFKGCFVNKIKSNGFLCFVIVNALCWTRS